MKKYLYILVFSLFFNSLYSQCEDGEFQCHEGTCIPSQWVCDGWFDCEDGSDEINCGELMCGDDFSCSPDGSECVPQSYICNGWEDCTNGADEINCSENSDLYFDKNIVGYYTSWSIYARDYHIADIPTEKINIINYAFANIDPTTGTVVLSDFYADIDKFYPGDCWDEG